MQARVILGLIKYPINEALCYICSLTKAKSRKHTRM